MIGKPEWFGYRVFGWGVKPKTWQGWAYVLVAIAIMLSISFMPIHENTKIWIMGAIVIILVADVLHIMTQLYNTNDERENMHQLIIERNCSFAAIAALLAVAMLQTYEGKMIINWDIPFDGSILIVLGTMLITKIASTVYVKNFK